MKTSLVLTLLLGVVSTPAFAGQIGPETAVAEPRFGPPCGYQYSPSVVAAGSRYFMAWTSTASANSGVLVARVAEDGVAVEPTGIPISARGGAGSLADLGTDGEDAVVVWHQDPRFASSDFRATHVLASGIVDSEVTVGSDWDRPRLAWNGSRYLLADRQHGLMLDRLGRPIGVPFAISQPVAPPREIAIASNGRSYLLAIAGYGEVDKGAPAQAIYTIEISSTGDVSAPRLITDHAPEIDPNALVYDGSHYAMAIAESTAGWSAQNLYHLDDHGNPVQPAITITLADEYQLPQLISNGDGVLLLNFSSEAEGLVGRRISARGELIDMTPVEIGENVGLGGDGAWNGSSYFYAWSDPRLSSDWFGSGDLGPDIFGLILPASLEVGPGDGAPDGTLLQSSALLQIRPAIASGSRVDLAVWEELDSLANRTQIIAARLDKSGRPLDGAGIIVADATANQSEPAVSFDGTNFLVVWAEREGYADRRIRGRFLGEDGSSVTSSIEISSAGPVEHPRVVSIDSAFAVVWEREAGIPSYAWKNLLYARRVGANGLPIESDEVLLTTETETGHFDPAVAWNGINLVVAYSQGTLCTHGTGCQLSSPLDLFTMIVTPDLRPLGSPVEVSQEPRNDVRPSLSWSGEEFLLVWTVEGLGFEGNFIRSWSSVHTMTLDENGMPNQPDDMTISGPEILDADARAIWDGREFTVIWRRDTPWQGLDRPLLGQRFDRDGKLSGSQFVVSADGPNAGAPSLVSDEGSIRVVYSRSAPELGLGIVDRVFSRSIAPGRRRPVRPDSRGSSPGAETTPTP